MGEGVSCLADPFHSPVEQDGSLYARLFEWVGLCSCKVLLCVVSVGNALKTRSTSDLLGTRPNAWTRVQGWGSTPGG